MKLRNFVTVQHTANKIKRTMENKIHKLLLGFLQDKRVEQENN